MNKIILSISFLVLFIQSSHTQTVQDDFEGNGAMLNWTDDNCNINAGFANPYVQSANPSAKVLKYQDTGGQFANVRFDVAFNFDLSTQSIFTLKIYVPSSGLTGNQPNQISLKLQNGNLSNPWVTQSEIIKPIVLNQWQTVSFDFANDPYVNFDPNSPPPIQRGDFNRVLLQVNGENNHDQVTAYIDDVFYNGVITAGPAYNLLVWSDEFEGNGAIDTAKWHHQTLLPNGASWYNGEIQHYTNRTANAYVSNGTLHIVGKKETYTDQGHTKQYTSARLNSKFAFQYGKVEVRAKLPAGIGTWPAIWTLGKNIQEVGGYWNNQGFGTTDWPACGEIDIMEHWGANQNYIQSAIHTPSSFGNTVNFGGQSIATASTSFHTYALEWYPQKLVFSVDSVPHYTYQPNTFDANTWPFDAAQYILLNFAILPGILPGFTQDEFEIDYVRVYQTANPTPTSAAHNPLFDLKNAPNPAANHTIISYTLPEPAEVKLFIHDVSGKRIQTLVNETQPTGQHQVKWDVQNQSSGTYFYTLMVGNRIVTERCLIEK
ncbi:MAG: family 16 glycosylhydrolase [Saprospiraceae bacterium]|nr:family 16 glycosylhydrolase [Saprospiraceae bacterium]